MPTIKPDTYTDRDLVWEHYQKVKPTLEKQLHELHLELRSRLEGQGFRPTIKYRVKEFDGFFKKLATLSREKSAEPPLVKDLLGIRVICPFLEDLDQVERLIIEHFDTVEFEHKGESLSFREFGYDSVHLLIRLPKTSGEEPVTVRFCEIQLRTILQDAWAEVEHELVYKSELGFPNESIKRKLASLNASLALSDLIFQEIRDYQNELRRHGIRRRQSVEEVLSSSASVDGCGFGEITPSSAEEALFQLEQKSTPRDLEKLMFRALAAHSNKDFQLAVQIYGRILEMKLEPTISSLIYNHRGMALFALADCQKAVEDFDRAVQYNGENVRAWCNRGLAYRIMGLYDLSLADYQQALQLGPNALEAYWGRAQTYYEMEMYTRALADCEQALALQEDFNPAAELKRLIHGKLF